MNVWSVKSAPSLYTNHCHVWWRCLRKSWLHCSSSQSWRRLSFSCPSGIFGSSLVFLNLCSNKFPHHSPQPHSVIYALYIFLCAVMQRGHKTLSINLCYLHADGLVRSIKSVWWEVGRLPASHSCRRCACFHCCLTSVGNRRPQDCSGGVLVRGNTSYKFRRLSFIGPFSSCVSRLFQTTKREWSSVKPDTSFMYYLCWSSDPHRTKWSLSYCRIFSDLCHSRVAEWQWSIDVGGKGRARL